MALCIMKFTPKVAHSGKSYYLRVPQNSVNGHGLADRFVDVEMRRLDQVFILKFTAKVAKVGKGYYIHMPLSAVNGHKLAGSYVDVELYRVEKCES